MFQESNIEIVPLTPELARHFAEMEKVTTERPLSSTRLKFLESKIRDGVFHGPEWATATVRSLSGKCVRVNGQHSSTALANANGSFPQGLSAIIRRFECDTVDDLPELFAQIDSPKSGRSRLDLHNAHLRMHPELSDVSVSAASVCTAGISLSLRNFKAGRISDEASARLIHMYRDFILWASSFMGRSHIKRPGIVAAMFAMHLRDEDAASAFWRQVDKEDHPMPNHGTRKLAIALRASTIKSADSYRSKVPVNSLTFYAACIDAWNAVRENRTVTHLKFRKVRYVPEAV